MPRLIWPLIEGVVVNEIEPEAYCDALFVLGDAPKSLLPMSIVEMHLFSYLGCILALFRGEALGNWGYQYAVTTDGFPFSAQFEEARKLLVEAGLVEVDDDGHLRPRLPELTVESEAIMETGAWSARRAVIRSAMDCALALPLGAVRFAIRRTPGMSSAAKLRQRRRLLDPDDVTLLYDEYKVVHSVLGGASDDMLSPAVIWLSARVLRQEDVQLGAY
jgi:hypothetical protein